MFKEILTIKKLVKIPSFIYILLLKFCLYSKIYMVRYFKHNMIPSTGARGDLDTASAFTSRFIVNVKFIMRSRRTEPEGSSLGTN